jgi:hypothetical protein
VEAKVFADSLNLRTLGFVKIDNIPLLSCTVIVTPNTNCLSFLVFASLDVKDLVALPVDELVVLISEYLEPSRVSAPDLHVIGLTSILDVPRLIVVSSPDGQRLLMEVPDLGSSAVWNLDNHVSVVDQVKISVSWK